MGLRTDTVYSALNGYVNKSVKGMLLCGLTIAIGLPMTTLAAPAVLVDITPTHSLVSMVMGDIGKPELLIDSASNPHDFALRPSDAAKLTNADLIFYTSSTLTPWLSKALESLAQNTPTIELINADGTQLLPLRNNHLFSHAEHPGHEEHDESSGQVYDPHAWLDPAIAIVWIERIADQLADADSANATAYQKNAGRAIKNLHLLTQDIMLELTGLDTVPYLVFHDSYQYFETKFNLQPTASISLGDGTQPGISQIRALQAVIKSSQARCVFSEPQYSERLVNTVVSGTGVQSKQLDPLGFGLEIGQELYPKLIKNLASSLYECLSVK